MPKSTLPIGTTPHRRKKAPTKKSTAEMITYGDDDASTKMVSKSTKDNSSKSHTANSEKENSLNGSKTHVDQVITSMAHLNLNAPTTAKKSKHKLQKVNWLSTHHFPPIQSTPLIEPLTTSMKHLKDDTLSISPTLLQTIHQSSLHPAAPSFSIEESTPLIKNVIKSCLKSPSYHSLRLAIHCLRAVPSLDRVMSIKSAFHACVLSCEEMIKLKDEKEASQFAILCLASYQSLGRCVKSKFQWEDGLSTHEILPKRQRIKIGCEGGIAAANAFLYLHILSLRKISIRDEFGLDLSGNCFGGILQNVVFPLLLEEGLEVVNEGSKYAKRIFRLLWDGAREAQESDLVLHLQCFAVSFLGRYCVEAFPSCDSEGKKELYSLWDRAASSALKAVAVLNKQANDKKEKEAMDFHNVAGKMLDNVWILFHSSGKVAPPSYLEYCVYRSVHQWKLLGDVDSIHAPEDLLRDKECKYSTQDLESLAAMASFSVVLLALQARVLIANAEKGNTTLSNCDVVVANFEAVIRNASPASKSRCRSMIMLLNLQREATKLMALHRYDTPEQHGRSLSALGYILGRCMAPLETRLADTTDDEQRGMNLRLSASDNHAKAASFLDAASQDSSVSDDKREKWSTECFRQIRKGYELLSPILEGMEVPKSGSPAVLATEVFAKVAIQNAASSIECHSYASELLTRLASKSSNHTSFDKYQIPSRYTLLSSVLEANGNMEESCVAMALAVWGAAQKNARNISNGTNDENNSFIGDTVSEELLLFPAAALSDIQTHPRNTTIVDGLVVMINKLARACIGMLKSTQSATSNAVPLDTLLTKFLQTTTNESKAISTSKLLDSIIWDNGTFTISQTLELIREILKCTAKVLKSFTSSESDDHTDIVSTMTKELNEFVRLQINRLENLVTPEDLQVISSGLHVSLAMYLIDPHLLRFPKPYSRLRSNLASKVHSTMICSVLDQLQQAENLFARSNEDDCAQDTCFFVQWAAVLLHQAIVFEHQQLESDGDHSKNNAIIKEYMRVLDICNQAFREIVNSDDNTFQVVDSLIATLKRLLCRFSLHGDPVSSSQCFVHLQKLYSLDEQSHHIFDSVSDFLWISSKFDDLATVLFRNCIFNSSDHSRLSLSEEIRQLSQDEQMELVSNCIVDMMVVTSQQLSGIHIGDILNQTEQSLNQISEFIEANLSSFEDDQSDDEMDLNAVCARSEAIVQIQSFVITILMLRSKMFLTARQPESSIKCLNACRIECKRMISLLRMSHNYLQNHEDKVVQVDDLLSMGLERLSIAFSSLGMRKRAEDNAILAVVKQKTLSIESPNVNKITFQELIDNIERLDEMYNLLPPIRTLITIKSLSLSADKLSMEAALFDEFNPSSSNFLCCTSINDTVNRSRTLLTYDDSFRYVQHFKSQCVDLLSQAHRSIVSLMNEADEGTSSDVPLASFVYPVEQEIRLRMIRQGNDKSEEDTLQMMGKSRVGTPSCLAEAYLELGLEALEKAKTSKELHHLWNNHSIPSIDETCAGEDTVDSYPETSPNTNQARQYLNCALLHANPASSHVTKKILRCLALATGPETLTAFLIHSSIGGTSRNIVRNAIDSTSRLHKIFNLFDDETSNMDSRTEEFNTLIAEYSAIIPTNWTTSAMAICPTGDILITSFRASNEGEPIIKTVCIFTSGEDNIHENVIVPLDQIIDRSQKQLRGIDEETQSAKYNDEASKRKWWNERHSIDEDLCSLLQTAQDSYFGHDLVRRLLLSKIANVNRSNSDDDSSDCSDIGPGNLASRFEAAEHEPVNEFDEEAERLALKKLTVTTLKEKLNSFGVESSRIQKMRKADLLDLVILEMEKDFQETTSKICIGTDGPEATTLNSDYSASGRCEPCSILILDENLHRLPLESMDMFANTAVTRMPSLPFLFATLYESQSANDGDPIPQVDPAAMKFILDPEQNLSETASKMEPALNSMASANGWEWKGCVGEMPTQEFMSDSLTQEYGLLLYCGHGGGEKFFSRSQVEELINCYSEDESERHRGCSSTIVLMGCSSGKLKSVNCPNSPSGPDYPMHYEPEGIILSYIYAGAPCVVGNLWDVTDRDIDRYCITLLQDFFDQSDEDSPAPSLAKCVALARRACKLRYIVGSSPVCYGIPVQCRQRSINH